GDPALIVTAASFRQRAEQRLLRRRACDLSEICDAGSTTTGSRGLVFTNSHVCSSSLPCYSAAVKMSMDPDFRVTIARLVFLRWPIPKRVRRLFPLRLSVLTLSTLTLKTCSMASLISVFVAVGSTSKVY